MIKLIQHNIPEERHNLTKLLKLDMFDMMRCRNMKTIEFYEDRMLGFTAAYFQLGMINLAAYRRYIDIIVNAAFKRREEIV